MHERWQAASAGASRPEEGKERGPVRHASHRTAAKPGASSHGAAVMFEKDEVLRELHERLVAAGINPLDPKVQTICDVVNAFYAEKTRIVLQKMQEVLNKIEP
jgi:hypothetical protein